MTACIGIGRLLGHRYGARYSERRVWPEGTETIEAPSIKTKGMSATDMASLVERLTDAGKNHERSYEGDVCERCGDVVNRQVAA